MNCKLNKLYCDKNGQVMIFVLAILFVLVLFFLTIPNVTHIVSAKMRTQTAADFGAYSGAIWLARGLNIIACLNIGIRTMYIWIAAISVILVVFSALFAIGFIPFCEALQPIAMAVLGIFFDPAGTLLPTDPVTAAIYYKEDVKRLYNTARWLSDRIDNIAEVIPDIAMVDGSTIALQNMQRLSGLGFAVTHPFPPDKIPLEPMQGFDQYMNQFASFLTGGGGASQYGGSNGSKSGSFQNGNFNVHYEQEYIKSITVTQKFRKFLGREEQPPGSGNWVDVYDYKPPLQRTFEKDVDEELNEAYEYHPSPTGGDDYLSPGEDWISDGYEMYYSHWDEHKETEPQENHPDQENDPPVPKKLDLSEPLYAVAYTTHSSTRPIVANTERTFRPATAPLTFAVGQAAPYLTEHPDDLVFDIIGQGGDPLLQVIKDYLLLH